MPLAFVVTTPPAGVTLPLPAITAKVTLVPAATGLLFASVTSTAGFVVTAWPTVAVWPSPADSITCAAVPAVPVAVKVCTASAPAVAVSVFAPVVLPSVQLPRVATPLELVVTTPSTGVAVPPPLATAKVTLTPLRGLSCASVIVTAGRIATALPAVALCPSPADFVMFAGAPAVPVAVNVAVSEPVVAVNVFAPAVAPTVHVPSVAMPDALVVVAAPVTLPPPLATANVTFTPATGLLLASVISTAGAVASAVPTVA